MPDKQAGNLTATGFMVQRTPCVERVMDLKLSVATSLSEGRQQSNADIEKILELLFSSFPERRRNLRSSRRDVERHDLLCYPTNGHRPVHKHRQRGGCGMASAVAKRVSVWVGSLVATLPAVLADLSAV